MMDVVVDTNSIHIPEVGEFLRSSSKNRVILTDYVMLELYKSGSATDLNSSLKVVAQHPRQILIIKGIAIVCGLKGVRKGLRRRFVDTRATSNFAKYCNSVQRAAKGSVVDLDSLNPHFLTACETVDKMRQNCFDTADLYEKLSRLYTKTELKSLRQRGKIPGSALQKLIDSVFEISWKSFEMHPNVSSIPEGEEILNTFIFQASLFHHLHLLNWMRNGSPESVNLEKISNDRIDILIAAYATFFDLLFTNDKRLNSLYNEGFVVIEKLQKLQKLYK